MLPGQGGTEWTHPNCNSRILSVPSSVYEITRPPVRLPPPVSHWSWSIVSPDYEVIPPGLEPGLSPEYAALGTTCLFGMMDRKMAKPSPAKRAVRSSALGIRLRAKQPAGCMVSSSGLGRSGCRVSRSLCDTNAIQFVGIDALDECPGSGEGEQEGHADNSCDYQHGRYLSLRLHVDSRCEKIRSTMIPSTAHRLANALLSHTLPSLYFANISRK